MFCCKHDFLLLKVDLLYQLSLGFVEKDNMT